MRASSAGYSLLELMVVLGILSLIALVAVPALGTSIERATLASDARDLATQLRALRAIALDRQTEITITPSTSEPSVLVISDGSAVQLSSGTSVDILTNDRGVAQRFVISAEGIAVGAFRLSRGWASSVVAVDRMSGRISVEVGR